MPCKQWHVACSTYWPWLRGYICSLGQRRVQLGVLALDMHSSAISGNSWRYSGCLACNTPPHHSNCTDVLYVHMYTGTTAQNRREFTLDMLVVNCSKRKILSTACSPRTLWSPVYFTNCVVYTNCSEYSSRIVFNPLQRLPMPACCGCCVMGAAATIPQFPHNSVEVEAGNVEAGIGPTRRNPLYPNELRAYKYENAQTLYQVFQRGLGLNPDGPCMVCSVAVPSFTAWIYVCRMN